MPIAIYALAIGATTFVIKGSLLQVSADLGVTALTVGFLITGYAFGLFFGAPLLTWLGAETIDYGLGLQAAPVIAGPVTVSALAVALISVRLGRRRAAICAPLIEA